MATKALTKAGRTFERQTFLADVVTTALEGGIGYWCKVGEYRWWSPDLSGGSADHEEGFPNAYALEAKDTDEVYDRGWDDVESWGDITVDTIELGITRIIESKGIRRDLLLQVLMGDTHNDAGEIDASAADCIVQYGLLGELVYG